MPCNVLHSQNNQDFSLISSTWPHIISEVDCTDGDNEGVGALPVGHVGGAGGAADVERLEVQAEGADVCGGTSWVGESLGA